MIILKDSKGEKSGTWTGFVFSVLLLVFVILTAIAMILFKEGGLLIVNSNFYIQLTVSAFAAFTTMAGLYFGRDAPSKISGAWSNHKKRRLTKLEKNIREKTNGNTRTD